MDKILEILIIILLVCITDEGYFSLTEKFYCKKYFKNDRTKCKAWSCRFYDQCHKKKDE